MPTVSLTIDLEPDCLPYLGGLRGVEEGMPLLLDTLGELDVQTTVFSTGEVAQQYPHLLRDILEAGHELGCHSHTHPHFGRLSEVEARTEIEESLKALRAVGPVTAFRAPYLTLPGPFVSLLEEADITLDSSQAVYKPRTLRETGGNGAVRRIPASVPPSLLRLPALLRDRLLLRLSEPVVLFVHPWEFVDLRQAPIPWDCRAGTGPRALESLREVVALFREAGWGFQPLGAAAETWS